jgi:hypothetical protein
MRPGGLRFQEGSAKKKDHKTPSLLKKLGIMALTCNYSDCGKPKIGGLWSRLAWAKSKTLSSK